MRQKRCATPTAFGKEMRKLRIDLGETMKDTCSRLGITQAYISHLENGKCQAPDGFEEKVIAVYKLSDDAAQKMRSAAMISKNRYIINAKTNFQKLVAYKLSRNINLLDDEELNGIDEFIDECIAEKKLTSSKDNDNNA